MGKTAPFLFAQGVNTTARLKLLCEHNAKIRSSITAHIAHLHARPEATSNVRLASNIILGIHANVRLTHNAFPCSSAFLFPPISIQKPIVCFCFYFHTRSIKFNTV